MIAKQNIEDTFTKFEQARYHRLMVTALLDYDLPIYAANELARYICFAEEATPFVRALIAEDKFAAKMLCDQIFLDFLDSFLGFVKKEIPQRMRGSYANYDAHLDSNCK